MFYSTSLDSLTWKQHSSPKHSESPFLFSESRGLQFWRRAPTRKVNCCWSNSRLSMVEALAFKRTLEVASQMVCLEEAFPVAPIVPGEA